jgi:hypothetical protein
VLAAQAQDLHTALRRVADDGWSYVILDGKLFDCDRLTETTLSVKGETIDAWYSGKHRDSGRMTAFLDQGAAQARPAALGLLAAQAPASAGAPARHLRRRQNQKMPPAGALRLLAWRWLHR